MEGSGSSGFDMSKMSTAEKLLAGASILLLLDSFLPWQVCTTSADSSDLIGRGVDFNDGGRAAAPSSGSSWACSRSRSSSSGCSR